MNSGNEGPIDTGLSEQERKTISERVLFEVQLRKELESEQPGRRQRLRKWLESNFALLVVGSLISSLLVPYFQQQQEVIRWQKQNQYDNLKYKLGQMRSGLEEFLTLSAYAPAMTEISKPVLANPKLNPEAYARFAEAYRDMKQKGAVATQYSRINAASDAVILALRKQIEESERENETFK